MPPLKPWTCIDQMRGSRLIALALLSSQTLPVPNAFDWSDSSSSSSSSSDSSADWDAFFSKTTWNNTVTQFGFGHLMDAALPFSRKKISYKVGPERYSFERLEREYGSGDASCKAAFSASTSAICGDCTRRCTFPTRSTRGTSTCPARRPS